MHLPTFKDKLNKKGNRIMKLVNDVYSPVKCLPVHVTHDGMELLETSLGRQKTGDNLFVEIGVDEASTGEELTELLKKHFSEALEIAFEEECEQIQFYI